MIFVKRASIFTLFLVLLAGLLATAGFIWSGTYDIGADVAHTRPVYTLLRTMRDRSITARAREIHPPPSLVDPRLIRQGAGNYAAMCAACHLAPGLAETELSRGLYPAPPALATSRRGDPSHHFWIIKHGIKASGMPAWGRSMDDPSIWGLVAFLQKLPELDPREYQELVASSGGHSHGGGELATTGEAAASAATGETDQPASMVHRHADGTVESHPVAKPGNASAPSREHDHPM